MRETSDTRTCPNAIPVGKLGGAQFAPEFANLDDLPPLFIIPLFLHDGAEVVFRSTDFSMLPAGIVDGDLLYVKPEPAIDALRGHVVVARLNNDYFTKRLLGPDDALVLASDDALYRPIEIQPDDEFYPLGVVVGRHADGRAFDRTWEEQKKRRPRGRG